jgi:hypothetical protein
LNGQGSVTASGGARYALRVTARHPMFRSTLLYLLFVGVPLLGLVAVLHAGRGIAPTVCVTGQWRVEAPPRLESALVCGADAADPEHSTLEISQTGRRLALRLGERKLFLPGQIDGHRVSAIAPQADGPRAHFAAEIDAEARPRVLAGTLMLSGCPSAETGKTFEVPIRAVRETSPREKRSTP